MSSPAEQYDSPSTHYGGTQHPDGPIEDQAQQIESRIMPATAAFSAHSPVWYQLFNFKKSSAAKSSSSGGKKMQLNPIHVTFVVTVVIFILFQMRIISF